MSNNKGMKHPLSKQSSLTMKNQSSSINGDAMLGDNKVNEGGNAIMNSSSSTAHL